MIQIRCTSKLRKEWKIKPHDLADIKANTSPLGNWYAHLFTLDRRKTLLFVNEKTLVSFIILGAKQEDLDKLAKAFILGAAQVFLLLGVTKDKIARILSDYDSVEFTKTANRSILGVMNGLIAFYKTKVKNNGGLKYTDLDEAIYTTNTIPQRVINNLSTVDFLHRLIEEIE